MINKTLLQKEIKSNVILFFIFVSVLTMYGCMIVIMFDPKLGDSIRMMADSMPEIFAAFGMADMGTTLLEFITNYLYGMIFVVFPTVYIVILANRLIARYVDNGSIAYLLSIPRKRRNLAGTQAFFMILSLFTMVIYITTLILVFSECLFPGKLASAPFLRLNVGLFGVFLFFGGICFFFSCFFHESKYCTGASAAVVVYSVLVQMISQVGDTFANLKYATPLTLFDTEGLTLSHADAWRGCAVLYIVGILCYIIGVIYFSRKNLSV